MRIFFVIVIVSIFAPVFSQAGGLVPCGGCNSDLDPVTGECPASQVQSACNLCHAFELTNRIVTFILVPSSFNGGFAFVFLLGGLLLVVAGFFILVGSLGNPPLLSRGKTILFATLIGLLIIYGSWVAIGFALDFFGVADFTGTGNWWAIQCGVLPSLNLAANPSTVSGGESTTIFWDALGVSGCTASGQWSGTKPAGSESEVVTPPSALGTYTYNLSCTGLNGNPSASVVVTVTHKAPVVKAGPDQVVTLPFTGSVVATMAGEATDDNLPPPGSLTILWTQTSGPVPATIIVPSSPTTGISFTQVGIYEFELSADDSEKQSSDSVAITVLPAPPLLLAHWDFNDLDSQDDILDKKSTNHGVYNPGTEGWRHGTVFGASLGLGAPSMGQGFDFDNGENIDAGNAMNLNPGFPFTISTWIFKTGLSSPTHILGKRVGCGIIGMNYQTALLANRFQLAGANSDLILETSAIPDNEWVHLAASSDGTSFRLYVNGSLAAGPVAGSLGPVNTGNFKIGTSGSCPSSEAFDGSIDEVRVYNKALTQAQIADDKNSRYPIMPAIGSWSFENLVGGQTYDTHHIVKGAQEGAGKFDNLDDFVNMGDVLDMGTQDFTIAYCAALLTDGSPVSKWLNTGTAGYYIYYDSPAGTYAMISDGLDPSARGITLGDGDTTPSDGSWHHIAAVFTRSTDLKLYIDGVPGATDSGAIATEPGSIDTGQTFNIGRSNNLTDYLGGLIDDVKIWDKALTAAEVANENTALGCTSAPPPPPPVCSGPDSTCFARQVDVSNPGAALTNYQVKFTLDTAALISEGKMRSDCGDLRVTDSNGATIIKHWLESGCNSLATNIWARVPSLPGSATKTIYATYGNASVTSTSDFAGTFPSRYILTTGTDNSAGAQSYDWFEVKSGATFNITDENPQSVTARKIVIAGTVNGVGRGFDGAATVGSGQGPGAGSHKSGGAYGGAGGQGKPSTWGAGGTPGLPYGSVTSQAIEMGSGGGASDGNQAPGGDGGGAVTIRSQEIVISGSVTMAGGSRGTGTNQNGGGGGGGILILSSRVNLSGTLSVAGGDGDGGTVRAGGAGGGGGGRIKVFSDESISDTSAKNVNGGSGSPGGTNGGPFSPGDDGAPGTTHIATFTSLEPATTLGPEVELR